MAWSLKKILLVTGGTVVGGAVCFFTAGAAAPAIGALVGSTMGLSGAAATSAGLAALGGGALAAGGGGMAAGAALVTASLTGAGALLGTLGMGTMANFFRDSNKEFDALLDQKNYAKAQEIIRKQEVELRKIKEDLAAAIRAEGENSEKVRSLENVVAELTKVIDGNRERLQKVA